MIYLRYTFDDKHQIYSRYIQTDKLHIKGQPGQTTTNPDVRKQRGKECENKGESHITGFASGRPIGNEKL